MGQYGWLDGRSVEFNNFLFLDRWVIRMILKRDYGDYRRNMGVALKYNPSVAWYFAHKCPEAAETVASLISQTPDNMDRSEVRKAEIYIIDN